MSETYPRSRPFLEDGAQAAYDRAHVAVLPVAYEGTASWVKGTARGPAAILAASVQLELFDEQSGERPDRCGVWTAAPIDGGDDDPESVVGRVAERFGSLLDAGKWPVMIGGEHSITIGAVRAAAARHDGLAVMQLDAHADLRDRYLGSRFNHACTMRRCLELAPVRAVGVRSYSSEEADLIASGVPGYRVVHAHEMQQPDWYDRALDGLAGRPVYLTIDLDYFDPAVIPATGTPEPGGGGWWPTLELLERLFRETRVVGADVVELSPVRGLHHADYTAARLVYKLIGFAAVNR